MNYCKMALFHNKVKKEKIAQYLKFHDISFRMNFYKRAAKVLFSNRDNKKRVMTHAKDRQALNLQIFHRNTKQRKYE